VAVARSVLIVEDDPAIREILTVVVGEELGVPVMVARDGAEALERAQSLPPTVVLLDLMLPETDGFEVARQLRAQPGTAGAWIIAISAAGSVMESAARNAGCDEFVPKPFELDDLIGRVMNALAVAERDDDAGNVIRFPSSA
jgi:DNA-binding response OmpR family regulator